MMISNFTAGITAIFTLEPPPSYEEAVSHLYLNGKNETHHIVGGATTLIVAPNISENWQAGDYLYSLRFAQDENIIEIETGNIKIKPNLAIAGDYRTDDEKILDNINAILNNKATLDQQQYKIQNRELYRIPRVELFKIRTELEKKIAREKKKNAGKGSGSFKIIPISFVRG